MSITRSFFFVLLFALAAVSLADKPMAGTYYYTNPDDEIKYQIELSARGKNFQVEGDFTDKHGHKYTLTGTLFGATLKFKGMFKGKDKQGKAWERKMNGDWSPSGNYLAVFNYPTTMKFTKNGEDVKDTGPEFTGTWESSYGTLTLTQSGKSVSGTSDYHSLSLEGQIRADGNLYFKWTQKAPDHKGTGFFKLGGDGKSFHGSWNYTLSDGSAGLGGGWDGKRKN